MFPKRFIFSILLLLLVTPYLGAQEAAVSNTTTVAPVVVDVTTAKPAPAESTTAKAVLIVEDSTTAVPAAPASAAPAEPKPEATTKAPEPAAKPAEPAAVPKPAAPAAKPAEPAPKAPEVTTKAPEPAPAKAGATPQAAAAPAPAAPKAPEVTTKAPAPAAPKEPEATTKASAPAPAAPKAPEATTKAPAPAVKEPEVTTKAPAPAPKPVPVLPKPAEKTEDKKADALPAAGDKAEAEKTAPASAPAADKKAVDDGKAKTEEKTEKDVIAQNATSTGEEKIDSSKVVIVEPASDTFHIENATTPAEPAGQPGKGNRLINDFMSDELRNNGGIVVHILLLLYVCIALGIICDVYFLSSLEFISKSLNIPADIAGATFMAIGTSAPELFTSLIGVFILHDDIGTGTILGSAVFNLIFIPATCGLIIWKYGLSQAKISKYSILRDCLFYFVTITTLLLVLKDNEVDWVESLCMLGLFMVYLIIMYYNAKIGDLVKTDSEQAPLLGSVSGQNEAQDWQVEKNQDPDHEAAPLAGRARSYSIVTEEGDVQENSWINSSMFMKVLMFPVMVLFKITLPKPTKFWFPVTFAISIVWISVLTYISVYLVDIIGVTFGIPETVGGLTLLAAGTSFPELISSALVVKRAGLADMALCNSIGSNIFDILICLGLPWFLKSILAMFQLGTLDLVDTMVPIQSMGLSFTTFSLLITIILFVATLSCFKWRLGFGVGLTCLILYVIFITLATINEIVLN